MACTLNTFEYIKLGCAFWEKQLRLGFCHQAPQEVLMPLKVMTGSTVGKEALQAVEDNKHLSLLLCSFACEGARRVHKGQDGEAKMVCMPHKSQSLSVPVWLWHAKIAVDVFLQARC